MEQFSLLGNKLKAVGSVISEIKVFHTGIYELLKYTVKLFRYIIVIGSISAAHSSPGFLGEENQDPSERRKWSLLRLRFFCEATQALIVTRRALRTTIG